MFILSINWICQWNGENNVNRFFMLGFIGFLFFFNYYNTRWLWIILSKLRHNILPLVWFGLFSVSINLLGFKGFKRGIWVENFSNLFSSNSFRFIVKYSCHRGGRPTKGKFTLNAEVWTYQTLLWRWKENVDEYKLAA